MKKKTNIAKLLKDCQKGMELDCTMYEDVYFDYIDELNIIHCYVQHENYKTSITFNQHGTPNSDIKSKCVIFPKGKTTWEGFQRPFKDGDIISGVCFDAICIFKDEGIIKGTIDYYCGISGDEFFIKDVKNQYEHFGDIDEYNLATEGEKEILFDVIKVNGYKWNPKTKTLEKLPKFKVGDKIRHKNDNTIRTINYIYHDSYGLYDCHRILFEEQDEYELVPDIKPKFTVGDRIKKDKDSISGIITNISDDGMYKVEYQGHGISYVSLVYQDEWELVSNKFDISTLKPLKSEVLVRDCDDGMWKPTFWGKYLEESNYSYLTTSGYYKQCIPYKGNEHLLGTTDDCDEYFKIW